MKYLSWIYFIAIIYFFAGCSSSVNPYRDTYKSSKSIQNSSYTTQQKNQNNNEIVLKDCTFQDLRSSHNALADSISPYLKIKQQTLSNIEDIHNTCKLLLCNERHIVDAYYTRFGNAAPSDFFILMDDLFRCSEISTSTKRRLAINRISDQIFKHSDNLRGDKKKLLVMAKGYSNLSQQNNPCFNDAEAVMLKIYKTKYKRFDESWLEGVDEECKPALLDIFKS